MGFNGYIEGIQRISWGYRERIIGIFSGMNWDDKDSMMNMMETFERGTRNDDVPYDVTPNMAGKSVENLRKYGGFYKGKSSNSMEDFPARGYTRCHG